MLHSLNRLSGGAHHVSFLHVEATKATSQGSWGLTGPTTEQARAWFQALEDSTAQKGDGQYLQYMSPGNLSYFSALGACLADTTRGALADRKTTEIPWPEPLEEESKEPTMRRMGHELGT